MGDDGMNRKTVRIAVTGHRKLTGSEGLESAIGEVSRKIRAAYPDAHFQVLSCLAEGADRVLADQLKAALPADLVAILPLPENEYIHDFESEASVQAFESLKHRAVEVIVLQKGHERPQAYQSANNRLLAKSDLVVAIWDGAPSRGPGGTAEVISSARQNGLPLFWINNNPDSGACRLTEERLPAPFRPAVFLENEVIRSGEKVARKPDGSARQNMVLHFWREVRWILLGLVWLAGLILGFAGFWQHAGQNQLNRTAGDILYLTLQLISLGSGVVEGITNWMLQTARFLLPALTAYTMLQAINHLFREQLTWLRLWRLKRHVIICGSGGKVSQLAEILASTGYPVMLVGRKDLSAQTARNNRIIVLPGDEGVSSLLARARLTRASHLVCLFDDDQQNLQLSMQAYQMNQSRSKGRLICVAHMASTELYQLVKNSEMAMGSTGFQLEIFNTHAQAARKLIQEDPAFQSGPDTLKRPDHILVIGLGRLGENLVRQAAFAWYLLKESEKLRITILDPEAMDRSARLLKEKPEIGRVCQLVPIQADLNQTADFAERIHTIPYGQSIARIYVCLEETVLSFQVSLNLIRFRPFRLVPIYMQTDRDNSLPDLLKRAAQDADYQGPFIPFDRDEYTCSVDLVVGGRHEMLARGLYRSYVMGKGVSYAERPWATLTEMEKEANRQQADRIYNVLRAFGYRISLLQDWDAAEFSLDDQALAAMAKAEHELWCVQKRADGWRPGIERDSKRRVHPDLVDWDQLPGPERQKNIHFIQQLPALLAEIGFQIDRESDRLGDQSDGT